MTATITETIIFKNITAEELFNMFLNNEMHSKIIGLPVSISRKEGKSFKTFDGAILGKNLHIVPNRLIVQSWRGINWTKECLDSILILTFSNNENEAQIELLHTNIPAHEYPHIDWDKHYWKPWKAYLEKYMKVAV
jgi:activator of HSP90 ATPase